MWKVLHSKNNYSGTYPSSDWLSCNGSCSNQEQKKSGYIFRNPLEGFGDLTRQLGLKAQTQKEMNLIFLFCFSPRGIYFRKYKARSWETGRGQPLRSRKANGTFGNFIRLGKQRLEYDYSKAVRIKKSRSRVEGRCRTVNLIL